MDYRDKIEELTRRVPIELVDFDKPRDIARVPTQASSNFFTNRQMGDWAEEVVFNAINQISKNFVAIKYGKSDQLVAGEDGFDLLYKDFQIELDTIGKRPDLLIFKKEDFLDEIGYDISLLPHHKITEYVKKAIAGIEVRSSAFLIDRYEEAMLERTNRFAKVAFDTRDEILRNYSDILEHPNRARYITLLKTLSSETISIFDFKVPGWRSTGRLVEVNDLFRKLKNAIKEIQKRDYLSITPKVEDIKVVYKWIETFNVPHYYFQVFFDSGHPFQPRILHPHYQNLR